MNKASGDGQALAGFILGIVGLIVFWLPFLSLPIPFMQLLVPFLRLPIGSLSFFLSFPIAIVGVILSARGRRSVKRRGLALVGLILSLLTLALSLLLPLLMTWAAFSGFS